MIYICNAFSLSMLNRDEQRSSPAGYAPRAADDVNHVGHTRVPRPVDDPAAYLRHMRAMGVPIASAVGHADTAVLFSTALGVPVECLRTTVRLQPADRALIGQYIGPRLPEGTAVLPQGARIEWWLV